MKHLRGSAGPSDRVYLRSGKLFYNSEVIDEVSVANQLCWLWDDVTKELPSRFYVVRYLQMLATDYPDYFEFSSSLFSVIAGDEHRFDCNDNMDMNIFYEHCSRDNVVHDIPIGSFF